MENRKKTIHVVEDGDNEVGYYDDSTGSVSASNLQPRKVMKEDAPSASQGFRGPMDKYFLDMGRNVRVLKKKVLVKQPENIKLEKEMRDNVHMDVGRFFYENAIPFELVNSPSFINMCNSIGNYSRGLKPPSENELMTWILKEDLKATDTIVGDIKKTWAKTGVSILFDGWSDSRNRTIINILVNNRKGTIFLQSIDASSFIKSANMLFEMMDKVVEEIGENLVVQVVTENTRAFKEAGTILMKRREQLYWTPCATHCLESMLGEISELPQHKNALLKAKKLSRFIHNRPSVLSLMRKFTKRDVLKPAVTRFATAFLTLQSICQVRPNLEAMFAWKEWTCCEGKEVKEIVLKDKTFWSSVVYAVKTTTPLVEVLRLVVADKEPTMGFLYDAMKSAKEKITRNFGGEEKFYKEIWDIVDQKWKSQLHSHLHGAAYYLNPHCQFERGFSEQPDIKLGLFTCIDRLIPDSDISSKTYLQCDTFPYKQVCLGYTESWHIKKLSPVEWWIRHGNDIPYSQNFAIKILGLTCSSMGCDRNWNTFNQVRTKRRNRLITERMHSLAYIMFNRRLRDRRLKLKSLSNEDDALLVDEMPSDDEWVDDLDDLQENDYEDLRSYLTDLMGLNYLNQKNRNAPESSSRGGKRKMVDLHEHEWGDIDGDMEKKIVYGDDHHRFYQFQK